jgi:WD40 repeat protein
MAGCGTSVPGDIYLPDCPLAQLDVLDRETGRLLPRPFLGHSRAILSLAFNQDGSMLASGAFGGDIMLWDLSATPQQVACRRAGRNLTQEEWERYFGEEPYRPTCPEKATPLNE